MQLNELLYLAAHGQWATEWSSTWGQTGAGCHASGGIAPCRFPYLPEFEAFEASEVGKLDVTESWGGRVFQFSIWKVEFHCGEYYGKKVFYVAERSQWKFEFTDEQERFLAWCESHRTDLIDGSNLAYQRELLKG